MPALREGQPVCLRADGTGKGTIFGVYRSPLAKNGCTADPLYVVRIHDTEEILVGMTAQQLIQIPSTNKATKRRARIKFGTGDYLQLITRARRATGWHNRQVAPTVSNIDMPLPYTFANKGGLFTLTSELDRVLGRHQNRGDSILAFHGAKLYDAALAQAEAVSFSNEEQAALHTVLMSGSATSPLGARAQHIKEVSGYLHQPTEKDMQIAPSSSRYPRGLRSRNNETGYQNGQNEIAELDSIHEEIERVPLKLPGATADLPNFKFSALDAECSMLFNEIAQQVTSNIGVISEQEELGKEVQRLRFQRLKRAHNLPAQGYLPVSEWHANIISKEVCVLDGLQLRIDALECMTNSLRQQNRTMHAQCADSATVLELAIENMV